MAKRHGMGMGYTSESHEYVNRRHGPQGNNDLSEVSQDASTEGSSPTSVPSDTRVNARGVPRFRRLTRASY